MQSKINQKKLSGFTLVELAIVIVIIGLLVSGVLQGQELIKQSKIRNAIKTLQETQSAYNLFISKYNAVPGDMPNATSFFSSSYNGTGNKYLDVWNSEGQYFWMHLASANLVKGSFSFASWLNSGPALFDSKSRYGALYVGTINSDPHYGTSGNFIMMRKQTTDASGALTSWGSTFSSVDTYNIDVKIDDGKASSGNFFGITGHDRNTTGIYCTNAVTSQGGNDYANSYASVDYSLLDNTPTCRPMFKLSD